MASSYTYSYSMSSQYNSNTGQAPKISETIHSREVVNGQVRKNVIVERVQQNKYLIRTLQKGKWIIDTNGGKYYTREQLYPYITPSQFKMIDSKPSPVVKTTGG